MWIGPPPIIVKEIFLFLLPWVLVVAIVILIRKPLQRRWFAGSGLAQWNATASTLPWRDRWTLYRVNSRGREAPARLAALAVMRGQSAIAVTERMVDRTSGVNKVWPIMAGLGVFMVAFMRRALLRIRTTHPPGCSWAPGFLLPGCTSVWGGCSAAEMGGLIFVVTPILLLLALFVVFFPYRTPTTARNGCR